MIQYGGHAFIKPEKDPFNGWSNDELTDYFGLNPLDPEGQATGVPGPVVRWGRYSSIKRFKGGTVHFYTDARNYANQLMRCPTLPLSKSRAAVAMEPPYHVWGHQPLLDGLLAIWKKRWVSHYWSAIYGPNRVKVLVDVTVPETFRRFMFLGVPQGWRAYCTRKHRGDKPDVLEWRAARCREHAGSDDLLLAVVGGGRETYRQCQANGWTWVPEEIDCIRDKRKWLRELRKKSKMPEVEAFSAQGAK